MSSEKRRKVFGDDNSHKCEENDNISLLGPTNQTNGYEHEYNDKDSGYIPMRVFGKNPIKGEYAQ